MFEDTKRVKNRRMTDNTIVKRKMTKGQITICKTLHGKLKIEQQELIKNRGELGCSGTVSLQFLFHMWHSSCYSCYKHDDMSGMRKGLDCHYDKRNISVVICDTDTP